MQRTRLFKSMAIVAAAGLAFAACGDDEKDSSSTNGSSSTKLCDASKGPAEKTKVKLQLQWFTQAQFAGYYAAVDQGCYAEAGLDVEIIQGAVEIVPQDVLASLPAGRELDIRCDGCPAPLAGRVSFVSTQAEYTPPTLYSKESRHKLLFLVEARLQAGAASLRPGQPVDVRLK